MACRRAGQSRMPFVVAPDALASLLIETSQA
jgi:hypothetical protein